MDKLINDFSFGLFFWVAIIFVILIILMRKFAWKPILDALNTREEGIRSAIDEAEKARKELKNLQANNEKALAEARAERDAMLKEARQMKDNVIAEAKEEAQSESSKIIAQAQATIQSEKQAAIADLKEQVAEFSVEIAEKIIRKELSNDSAQTKLVEELIKEVTIS